MTHAMELYYILFRCFFNFIKWLPYVTGIYMYCLFLIRNFSSLLQDFSTKFVRGLFCDVVSLFTQVLILSESQDVTWGWQEDS